MEKGSQATQGAVEQILPQIRVTSNPHAKNTTQVQRAPSGSGWAEGLTLVDPIVPFAKEITRQPVRSKTRLSGTHLKEVKGKERPKPKREGGDGGTEELEQRLRRELADLERQKLAPFDSSLTAQEEAKLATLKRHLQQLEVEVSGYRQYEALLKDAVEQRSEALLKVRDMFEELSLRSGTPLSVNVCKHQTFGVLHNAKMAMEEGTAIMEAFMSKVEESPQLQEMVLRMRQTEAAEGNKKTAVFNRLQAAKRALEEAENRVEMSKNQMRKELLEKRREVDRVKRESQEQCERTKQDLMNTAAEKEVEIEKLQQLWIALNNRLRDAQIATQTAEVEEQFLSLQVEEMEGKKGMDFEKKKVAILQHAVVATNTSQDVLKEEERRDQASPFAHFAHASQMLMMLNLT